jgi:hypothetical protein
MTAWSEDELQRIDGADELDIAAVRRNGELRRSTPIWVVRIGGDVYVRAAYGTGSGWYGVARANGRAHIRAGGVQRDVAVEDPDSSLLDAVDAGYRSKYGSRYANIVDSLLQPQHRVNTVRLVPQETGR